MSTPTTTDLDFYLNFVLINAEKLVSSKVEKKVDSSYMSYFGLGSTAASLASYALDANDKIIETASPKLSENIPKALQQMGLDISLKKVFQQGPLFVMHAEIQDVDVLKLIGKTKGQEGADHMENIMNALVFSGAEEKVDCIKNNTSNKTKENIMNKLAEIIPQKMEKAGLMVEFVPCNTSDQCRWLFIYLNANTDEGEVISSK